MFIRVLCHLLNAFVKCSSLYGRQKNTEVHKKKALKIDKNEKKNCRIMGENLTSTVLFLLIYKKENAFLITGVKDWPRRYLNGSFVF